MAAKRSRTRAHRRDRRKAKASNWRREGKQAMGNRVGHGSGNSAGHAGILKPKRPTFKQLMKDETTKTKLARARAPLQVTLGELINRRRS